MKTKLTSEEIDQICSTQSAINATIVAKVYSILDPQKEDTAF